MVDFLAGGRKRRYRGEGGGCDGRRPAPCRRANGIGSNRMSRSPFSPPPPRRPTSTPAPLIGLRQWLREPPRPLGAVLGPVSALRELLAIAEGSARGQGLANRADRRSLAGDCQA